MVSGNNKFSLGDGVELEILDSYYYYNVASNENDHSVVCMINQGSRHFLFTGDLEEKGEEKLVEMNDIPEVTLYKAGHHGSKTSSNEILLSVIKPEIVCVCCCAGSPEYTEVSANMFPTQAFIDRVAPYTDNVYVTTVCTDYGNSLFDSMNGNIVVSSNASSVTVKGSASDTKLKDTEWFKNNRTCPDSWK
jgi:competence protein ComEC